jgi:hypothetical protein
MATSNGIDILENSLRKKGKLLDILLLDRTTGRNIIWATDSYQYFGDDYAPKKQILPDLVTGEHGELIQPRAAKSREEQRRRTKDKAEVFTPLEIIKQMNMKIDWAGESFPAGQDTWKQYVKELRLEITCGEAPFIVSRYNPTAHTRKVIGIDNRVGFLDRKLHVVSKYCMTPKKWLYWAKQAFKASYGYEWQGDNILIARENLLFTLIDYYKEAFGHIPSLAVQYNFTKIISWNIFQMDGLRFTVPMSCYDIEKAPKNQLTLGYAIDNNDEIKAECGNCKDNKRAKHTVVCVKIMDWQSGRPITFVSLLQDM